MYLLVSPISFLTGENFSPTKYETYLIKRLWVNKPFMYLYCVLSSLLNKSYSNCNVIISAAYFKDGFIQNGIVPDVPAKTLAECVDRCATTRGCLSFNYAPCRLHTKATSCRPHVRKQESHLYRLVICRKLLSVILFSI